MYAFKGAILTCSGAGWLIGLCCIQRKADADWSTIHSNGIFFSLLCVTHQLLYWATRICTHDFADTDLSGLCIATWAQDSDSDPACAAIAGPNPPDPVCFLAHLPSAQQCPHLHSALAPTIPALACPEWHKLTVSRAGSSTRKPTHTCCSQVAGNMLYGTIMIFGSLCKGPRGEFDLLCPLNNESVNKSCIWIRLEQFWSEKQTSFVLTWYTS